MVKIISFIILFFAYQNAFANMIITDFNEKINFTDYGREVETSIKIRISLKSNNQYYKEWRYIFDKRLKVNILEAKVIGKKYKTSFNNNELIFQFDNAVNGDLFEFRFKYRIYNENTIKYVRDEFVSIPYFASGANGNIVINIPNNLAVYSLNRKFTQNGSTYTWRGTVPKNGFSDFFFLTLKKAKWQVEILSEISSNKNISSFDMIIPLYFKNGNNKIEKYIVEANYNNNFAKIIESQDSIITTFRNADNSLFQVKVDAILSNDYDNKIWIKLNPQNYLKIDRSLSNYLQNMIYQIRQNTKEDELLYVILAQWVNKNVEYDINYVGKDLTTKEILEKKKGVCIHYAQLYNDLLRSVGIPSVIVSGISYNTTNNKFENHAWNLVYTNGDWRAIDPTWGLYSGILPVSHIFLYFENRPVINYTTYSNSSIHFKSNIQKNINFINEY